MIVLDVLFRTVHSLAERHGKEKSNSTGLTDFQRTGDSDTHKGSAKAQHENVPEINCLEINGHLYIQAGL